MKKVLLVFLISICPILLLAQQTITVVSNIKVNYSEKRGTYRWYKPVFAHEGSTLSADSADYNQGDNFFDAYGNVVITQPNGTVVYADKLHYTEDIQEALLTNNVRLIDQQATLTTNYLTYNMRSKIGTYINGGQIINERDTLNSQTGYYFETTQDAYFRNNVVVNTPDVTILTDTMRYNSGSKMAYFYGPTTINGKNGKLYTENGDYHTESDKARFGKNNLYTEGSKFLWGDSLIYDGTSGNGRAIKNVNFIDTTQHIVMRGQLGTYNKATQTTMVTQNAYIVIATKPDDNEKDTLADSTSLEATIHESDSLNLSQDSTNHSLDSLPPPPSNRTDSTYMSADTLLSQIIKLKDYQFANLKISREGGEIYDDEDDETESSADSPSESTNESPDSEPTETSLTPDSLALSDSLSIKETIPIDSLDKDTYLLDSLSSTIIPELSDPDSLAIRDSLLSKGENIVDTLKKKSDLLEGLNFGVTDSLTSDSLQEKIHDKVPIINGENKLDSLQSNIQKPKEEIIDSLKTGIENNISLPLDSNGNLVDSVLHTIPQQGDMDSLINKATQAALSAPAPDTLISDTAETRIVIAYHDVRIFKSDLQAIADSVYFGYPDSLIRCFGNPIFWAQGSQLSGDTAYMQLKNQKIDNILLQNKAFIVSTELDSSKYQQVKGRKISGFFTNDQLDRVFVDGNAESIYYTVEDNKFTGMLRSISSRIKVLFEDSKMTDVISIRKPSNDYYPIGSIPADKEFLEGFIWKPELRPKSKEEVIFRTKPKERVIPQKETIETDSTQTGKPIKRESEQEEESVEGDEVKTLEVQKDEELKQEEPPKEEVAEEESPQESDVIDKEEQEEKETQETEESKKEIPDQEQEGTENDLKGEQEVD